MTSSAHAGAASRRYAVLLVDFQQDFWTDEVQRTAPQLPGHVAAILVDARARDLMVVHVRAQFQPDESDWMTRYRLRGRTPCVAGTPGAATLPFAREVLGEPVVVKHSFDGFLRTELHDLLRARGVEAVMVCGLVTSTCVFLTAATATQLGYLVAVLGDCCSDHEAAHAATLASYQFMFDVVDSTEIDECRRRWDTQLTALGRR